MRSSPSFLRILIRREITDDDAISDHDLEGLPPPAPSISYSLDDDTDQLLTTREKLLQIQGQMEEFVNEMKYQINFADLRWLQTLRREGANFLRPAKACQDREHTFNTTRGPTPTTWDPKAASTMYYRTRPVALEMDT
jgi:hypothetical protein